MRSRDKITSATLELIERSGFQAVNVAAVAAAAGVSRQTVYSIFGSREELVSQAMAGLSLEVMDALGSVGENCTTACDHLIELIVAGRRSVRAHPLLATLILGGQDNPIFDEGMMARADAVVTELLTPVLAQYPPTGVQVSDVVQIVLRLGMSVVLFESDALRTDDDLRAFLHRWLGPTLAPTY